MKLRILSIIVLVLAIAACTTPVAPVVDRIGDVTVTPATATVDVGATVSLSAAVEVVSGTPATTVTWSSSDSAIATVSSSGVVTGVAVGTATVTATSTFDDEESGSATITVVEADPTSIAETATAAGFSTLVAALVEADLADLFADDDAGPFTVFAPTNAAFDALLALLDVDAAALLARADLAAILQYHVVVGEFLAADILQLVEDGGGTALIETLTGDDLVVTVVDGDVVLNGSIIVGPVDIIATNGVIHVIDGVLTVPMSFDAATDYAGFSGDADVTATPLSLAFPAFSGGLSPFTFSVSAGALPDDFVTVEFEEATTEIEYPSVTYAVELDTDTGEISGTTGYPGTFTGTVTVSDAVGNTLEADFSLEFALSLVYLDPTLTAATNDFFFQRTIDGGPATPNTVITGDQVRVSGINTDGLPDDGSLDLTFALECVSSRNYTSGDLNAGCGTSININEGDGTISREFATTTGTWTFDVVVSDAASGEDAVYRINITATSYTGDVGP